MFSCKTCEKVFDSKAKLRFHSASHSDMKLYYCKTCDKTMNSSQTFSIHQKRHREEPSPEYVCKLCDAEFQDKSELRMHRKVHTRPDYYCVMCDTSFRSARLLYDHSNVPGCRVKMSDFHKMFAPEEHRCPICDKRLCSKAQLYGHMNIHLDVKPHQCEICDRSFNSTASLQSHSFARGNTDGFKCSHCNVSARTFKCFKEHMRVFHSDIPLKSVECPVCKKTVQSTWELEKHMSNHREKSGGDEICEKTFNSRNSLKAHQNRYDLLVTCKFCGINSGTYRCIQIHMHKFHFKPAERPAERQESFFFDQQTVESQQQIVPESSQKVFSPPVTSYSSPDETIVRVKTFKVRTCAHSSPHYDISDYFSTDCEKPSSKPALEVRTFTCTVVSKRAPEQIRCPSGCSEPTDGKTLPKDIPQNHAKTFVSNELELAPESTRMPWEL
ncbi:unnamed protein product [Caenorhabditis sp. 36 PRJEB53466]|nr:unnamed protein product [Caenorhabditis sp. 36 PRJEB53466]